jgi:D-glycero-alpha-D-manno-heptose 1-phosphate guanylyltransferase
MQAIILAGGLGTRLKSVVSDKPKVLSLVAEKPFLNYIIQYLLQQGIHHFIFSLGHLADHVVDFLNENYSNLNYQIVIEETPLGTGGGIKKAMEYVTEDNFFIINGDTFFDVSLKDMMGVHLQNNADCTIALKQMNYYDRYGTVIIDEKNTIVSLFQSIGIPCLNGFESQAILEIYRHLCQHKQCYTCEIGIIALSNEKKPTKIDFFL